MKKLVQPERAGRRRTPAVLIGASLFASIGVTGLLTGGESTPRRHGLAVEETVRPQPKPSSEVASRASAPAARKPPRSVAKLPVAIVSPAPDPFYDAARCPSLEVIRALETASGSDALVEVVASAGQLRLKLGDEVDGRLLTFVGPHPKHGGLTVVFEGETGACSAQLRSSELALHRADREASLSPSGEAISDLGPRAAESQQTSEFALALGAAPANPSDFLPAETETPGD